MEQRGHRLQQQQQQHQHQQNEKVYLLTRSVASTKEFPDNSANRFCNVLTLPVDLDVDRAYVVGLTNLHVPIHRCVLEKDDHRSSNIQYNIGLFKYTEEEGYILDTSFPTKKLFSLAPNININGLYADGEDSRASSNIPYELGTNFASVQTRIYD